jgi:hypothetical protein
MSDDRQSAGRKANAALPPGRRDGQSSDAKITKIGRSARTRPGPDGVPPDEIGDTFRKKG